MDKNKLIELIEKGLSTYKIASELNISQTNTRYWIRKYGLNTKHLSKDKKFKNCFNGNNCKLCSKELTGAKILYCDNICKSKYHYLNDIKINRNTNNRQNKIYTERKLKLIEMAGGECSCCGYNKNYAVLQFHHKNPEDKLFSLDARKLSNTNWNSILVEYSKCILLCANCHIELHYPEKLMV